MSRDLSLQATIDQLQQALAQPLPGEDAQRLMAPLNRETREQALKADPNPRLSAVMALFFERAGETRFVLIERPQYDGPHSRQIAFPGGKKEASDPDLQFTALRETQEEVGIEMEAIEVLGPLSELYIPPSRFLVQPFVGSITGDPQFVADTREVDQVLEVPLTWLFDPNRVVIERVPVMNGQFHIDAPTFRFHDRTVWGATAMMLSEIRQMLLPLSS